MEKELNSLTIDEKAELLVQGLIEQWGEDKYGMKSFFVSDGASGIRRCCEEKEESGFPICYPSPSTYACSWDKKLIHQIGEFLGAEAKARGVDILFSPGCNIKRGPLCGRNFEYYSEDPALTAELATEFVKGIQSAGTGACVKHFAANNQETRRMSIDEKISMRALREVYLKAFEKPIREGKPDMVMTAYNRVNGEYCADHSFLLKQVLRGEWKYVGNVITDCVASHDLAKGIKNGLNLQLSSMNKESIAREVKELLLQKRLTEEELNCAVENTINLGKKCLMRKQNIEFDPKIHHQFAEELAADSMVLLKNKDGILPLKQGEHIVVIGAMAKELRYQGGGSNYIEHPYEVEQIYDAIRRFCSDAQFSQGYGVGEDKSDKLLDSAKKMAEKCDKVIVCIGLPDEYESEGYDRKDMELPREQALLLKEVAEVNKNVIVVMLHGAPIQMDWRENVSAILDAGLPGEAGGSAVAACLFGQVNPSGKLAETVPIKLEDTPCYLNFPGGMQTVDYAEGIYVGYRYYDKKQMQVAYPFGYGLSYTTFEYSNLNVEESEKDFKVTIDVKNTGMHAGKEIVQLYIRKPLQRYDCPVRELQDFDKVYLEIGEKKELRFQIPKEAFYIFDEETECWGTDEGTAWIEVGRSSREIQLIKEIWIEKNEKLPPITGKMVLKDIFERYGKREKLEQLFQEYRISEHHLTACEAEDITLREMACMNTLESLKWSEPKLTDEIIREILERINE